MFMDSKIPLVIPTWGVFLKPLQTKFFVGYVGITLSNHPPVSWARLLLNRWTDTFEILHGGTKCSMWHSDVHQGGSDISREITSSEELGYLTQNSSLVDLLKSVCIYFILSITMRWVEVVEIWGMFMPCVLLSSRSCTCWKLPKFWKQA